MEITTEQAMRLETALFLARRAARKVETMYLRREVEPRSELDELINNIGEFGELITLLREERRR